ncbi:hypothetical protein PG984_011359 [Apiospora sp. TS-2023a]
MDKARRIISGVTSSELISDGGTAIRSAAATITRTVVGIGIAAENRVVLNIINIINNGEPLLVKRVDAVLLGEIMHIHEADIVRVGFAEDVADGSLLHVNPCPTVLRMPAKARYLLDALALEYVIEHVLTADHEVNGPVACRGRNPGKIIAGNVDSPANLGNGQDVPAATEAAAGNLGALEGRGGECELC